MHKFIRNVCLYLLVILIFIPRLVLAEAFSVSSTESQISEATIESNSVYLQQREEWSKLDIADAWALEKKLNSPPALHRLCSVEAEWLNDHQWLDHYCFEAVGKYEYDYEAWRLITYIPVSEQSHDTYELYEASYSNGESNTDSNVMLDCYHHFCSAGNGLVICYECGYVEGSNNIPQYLPPSNLSNIREYQPSEYALRFVAIAEEMFEQNEGIINPFQYKYSWCAAFIGKCADAAGIASDVIPRSNGCTQIYNNLLKQGGQIVTNPMAGDLIFYKSLDTENAYSHIGIMLSETTSIQGNVGSQIKKLKKPTDYYYHYPDRRSTSGDIVYVRPNY